MNLTQTARGFGLVTFTDMYGVECSVQKSSLATDDAIWIGVDDASPKVMASEAASVGVQTTETAGWVPYPVPRQVLLQTHMQLNRAQVAELLPVLQHFVDTGDLP